MGDALGHAFEQTGFEQGIAVREFVDGATELGDRALLQRAQGQIVQAHALHPAGERGPSLLLRFVSMPGEHGDHRSILLANVNRLAMPRLAVRYLLELGVQVVPDDLVQAPFVKVHAVVRPGYFQQGFLERAVLLRRNALQSRQAEFQQSQSPLGSQRFQRVVAASPRTPLASIMPY